MNILPCFDIETMSIYLTMTKSADVTYTADISSFGIYKVSRQFTKKWTHLLVQLSASPLAVPGASILTQDVYLQHQGSLCNNYTTNSHGKVRSMIMNYCASHLAVIRIDTYRVCSLFEGVLCRSAFLSFFNISYRK